MESKSKCSRDQSVAAEQRFRLRRPAAEGNETFQRGPAGTHAQHFRAEPRAELRIDGAAAAFAAFLERAECIRREQFRPEITVITRRVAAGENVRERMRETLPRRWMHHGDLLANDFQR